MNALRRSGSFFLSHPIARRQPVRTIARIVRWQTISRLQAEVTLPWIEGTKLTASRGNRGATGNLYYGLHEFAPMAFTLHMLRPADVFVDGGANIGTYTLLASAIAGARTESFEPDPLSTDRLAAHIRQNGVTGQVTIHRAALGDRTGEVQFTAGLDTMNRVSSNGEQTVAMATLDSLALEPTLVKLDLEGGERAVVLGAGHTLRNPALLAIVCEDNAPEMAELLAEFDFERYCYDPFERRLKPEPRALPENGIFIRDIETVSSRVSIARLQRTEVFHFRRACLTWTPLALLKQQRQNDHRFLKPE